MSKLLTTKNFLVTAVLILFGVVASLAVLEACPFCNAVGLTFTDQMKSKDVVVAARLVERAPKMKEGDQELPRSKFEITRVFRGKKLVRAGMKFESVLVGRYPVGQDFVVMGVNPPNINWATPMKASDRLMEYFAALEKLPEKGADRLAFFQQYFEDEEPDMAFDAYDEFAKADYADMIDLKDRMEREKLIALIKDEKTATNRRRLYFTMLGICGQPEDVPMLEEMMLSGSRKQTRGLEALVACYLSLKGEAGVDLVQETFLANDQCEFTDSMLALQAVRFHASEGKVIPKQRLIEAVRTVLDRDEVRDMVIADLARWKDWTVMEKLVQIFRDSDDDDSWVRIPIISYLFACPLPKAKDYIQELAKIDPDAVARAKYLSGDFDFDDEDDDEDDEDPKEDLNDTGSGKSEQEKAEASKPDPETSGRFPDSPLRYVSAPAAPASQASAAAEQTTIHKVRKVDMGTELDPAAVAGDIVTAESETLANQTSAAAVATSTGSSSPVVVAPEPPLPQQPQPPVAQARITWHVVFIPAMVSVLLFVLLWSVMSGRFERLIF